MPSSMKPQSSPLDGIRSPDNMSEEFSKGYLGPNPQSTGGEGEYPDYDNLPGLGDTHGKRFSNALDTGSNIDNLE